MYLACRKSKVPAELHVYQQGPHGVGLADEHPALSQWITTAGTWLRQNGLLVGETRQVIQGEVKLNGEPMKWGTIAFKPRDGNAPVAWAMVSKGKFNISETGGTVPGICDVIVTSMGAVAPGPTSDGALTVGHNLVYQVNDGPNSLELDLTDKD